MAESRRVGQDRPPVTPSGMVNQVAFANPDALLSFWNRPELAE